MNDTKFNLIFVAALIAIIFILHLVNALKWNDGHCSCGGNWQYVQAVGHRFDTDFLYECDKCGRTYEFFEKY